MRSRTPSAFYDRASSSWKTSQGSFLDDLALTLSSLTLPRWGSMRNGFVYELPMSARRMAVTDGSLLPTPAAGNFNDGESVESWQARQARLKALGVNGNGMGTPLAMAVQLLKTPTAQLAVNGGSQHPDKRREGGHGPTLADQVEHLLPTPDTTHGRKTTRTALLLPGAVELLPTPNASDWKGSGATQGRERDGRPRPLGDMDLPEAVSLLAHSGPTRPQCGDGSECSDSQLLLPLSQDGQATA
jgi:hypothetical protein